MRLSLLNALIFSLGACWACTSRDAGHPAWEGDEARFSSEFKIQDGFFHTAGGQVYTGSIIVQTPTGIAYAIQVDAGRPIVFKDGGSRGVTRWSVGGLWVGVDAAWEQDFEERPEGLASRTTGTLFSGKIISVSELSGAIQVEYNYLNGVSHGPEIYFDENHQETSRQVWVNGKIPVSQL